MKVHYKTGKIFRVGCEMIFCPFKKTSAFTLTEILVVVIIVGVLAATVLPRYTSVIEKTRAAEGMRILNAFLGAQKSYFIENGNIDYADNIDDLDIEIIPKNFDAPVAQNDLAALVTIQRTGGAYVLTIDELGNITCAGAICGKLGCSIQCN
jgi:prepilin-type N-terminal cleavage/methylation domain-containing protein